MIDLKHFAEVLQSKLNNAQQEDDILSRFNDNVVYWFNIVSTEGEYKPPMRYENSNSVKKYINGVLSVVNDDKNGFAVDNLVVNLNTRLDLLIPDIDNETIIENKTVRFSDAVIDFINNTLALNEQYVETIDDTNYFVSVEYSSVVPGIKDLRQSVGNSLTASVYIDYSIVVQGVSSSLYELWVDANGIDDDSPDYQRVYYARMDLLRTSTQDSYIASDSEGVSRSSTQGTTLQLSIIKPFKFDTLDDWLSGYLFNGNKSPFRIQLKTPNDSRGTTQVTHTYIVVFSDSTKGIEGTLVPSVTCHLSEYFEPV